MTTVQFQIQRFNDVFKCWEIKGYWRSYRDAHTFVMRVPPEFRCFYRILVTFDID